MLFMSTTTVAAISLHTSNEMTHWRPYGVFSGVAYPGVTLAPHVAFALVGTVPVITPDESLLALDRLMLYGFDFGQRFVPPICNELKSVLVVYVWLTVVLNPLRFASRFVALSTALCAVFAVDEILALRESEVTFRLVFVAYTASF